MKNIEIKIDKDDFKRKLDIQDGKNGDDGKDGLDGINGLNGLDGKNGTDGREGIDGKDGKKGKDGSPDTPDEIIEKVNKAENKIESKQIKGLSDLILSVDKIGRFPVGGGRAPLLLKGAGIKLSDHVTELDFSTGLSAVYSGDGKITVTESVGDIAGLDGTITRSGNYISSVSFIGGGTLTITRDGNNYISSITDGTRTQTFTRNGSNQIISWAVA